MSDTVRIIHSLNEALHTVLGEHPDAILVGEDVADPYGGAFKATRGLSTAYPDRVISSPISEQAVMGVATGIALNGDLAIAEFMFGDFVPLAFDLILNFASKSVSMYGRDLPIPLVIRAPMGAQRGYGPTHSQQLQKHFIGIPNLSLFELSPFHEPLDTLRKIIHLGHPGILFEDKTLYTKRPYAGGRIDDLFHYAPIGNDGTYVNVRCVGVAVADCLILTSGGCAHRCLDAARTLLVEAEIVTEIVATDRLYPLDVEPLIERVERYSHIFIVEEGVAGGTWGAEIAQSLYAKAWARLANPIHLISSRSSIIPAAIHLEPMVVVSAGMIVQQVTQALRPA